MTDVLPEPHETCAVASLEEWKRALLMFDRVNPVLVPQTRPGEISTTYWLPPEERPPEYLQKTAWFDIADIREVQERAANLLLAYEIDSRGARTAQAHIQRPDGLLERCGLSSWEQVCAPAGLSFNWGYSQAAQIRRTAWLYRRRGIKATPCFANSGDFVIAYPAGDEPMLHVVLEQVPVVTRQLEWEQVAAFRADAVSADRYRALGRWLQKALATSSISQARDVISSTLEDYQAAVRKHGLETQQRDFGMLTKLVPWAAGTAAVLHTATNAQLPVADWVTLLSSGVVLAGMFHSYVVETKLADHELQHHPAGPMALIHDVQRKFGEV